MRNCVNCGNRVDEVCTEPKCQQSYAYWKFRGDKHYDDIEESLIQFWEDEVHMEDDIDRKAYNIDCNNKVDHPIHYTYGGIELIDFLDGIAKGDQHTPLEWGYVMSIIQYIVRAPVKNGLEDYKKAQWYLNRLVKLLEEQQNEKQTTD